MPVFTDQTGRRIDLPKLPQRVISLVPSQTELLFDLGLENEVVGITKFCIHPDAWFRTKQRVGGTKQLHLDIIHSLHPDLIIANKEENEKPQVEELARHFPVWTSDVHDLSSAFEMIQSIGSMTGNEKKATEIVSTVKDDFARLKEAFTGERKIPGCYLIWKDPWMSVGGDTFIHAMLDAAGIENVFADRTRYPEIQLELLPIAHCQLLLLSSEPYPFRAKHVAEFQKILPGIKILLVDGEMFSWYGSRMLYAADYFQELRNIINAGGR